MTAIFVHLSDIHFGQERNRGGQRKANDDARRQLIEDAATLVEGLPSKRASGIIVTGDIAFAGKSHEYQAAGVWLDELASRVKCEPSDIQMVPGNHDIDRDRITPVTRMMLDRIILEGDEALDRFLGVEADRNLLYARFTDYIKFSGAYQCPLDCAGENSAERRVELADGRAIRFVRLNSALVCSEGDQEGGLLLGQRQRVMETNAGEELIVLTHHPLHWYADSDDARRFLRGRARVFVSGHEHLAAVDVHNVEEGCDLMMLAAGATTPDEIGGSYTYAYNVIVFDWDVECDALAVTLYPRVWNDEMKRFESDDSRLCGQERRTVLGSPHFRRAPRPATPKPVEDTSAAEPAAVEIISTTPEEMNATPNLNDAQYQNLYLQFFRDLTEGERIRILVELDAIPGNLPSGLNHEMESRLFQSAVRSDRLADLREKIGDALAKRARTRETI